LADATEQLERAVLEAASWMEARGGALARDTHELLQTRTRQSAAVIAATAAAADTAAAGGYGGQRAELLLQMQASAREAIASYDGQQAAQRLTAATTSALVQVALLQASAAGLSSLVAVKAVSLADLTGLLPAALLALTGLFGPACALEPAPPRRRAAAPPPSNRLAADWLTDPALRSWPWQCCPCSGTGCRVSCRPRWRSCS